MTQKQKIAFTLCMIAGALCLGSFLYQYLTKDKLDYFILFAGIFVLVTGYNSSRPGPAKKE